MVISYGIDTQAQSIGYGVDTIRRTFYYKYYSCNRNVRTGVLPIAKMKGDFDCCGDTVNCIMKSEGHGLYVLPIQTEEGWQVTVFFREKNKNLITTIYPEFGELCFITYRPKENVSIISRHERSRLVGVLYNIDSLKKFVAENVIATSDGDYLHYNGVRVQGWYEKRKGYQIWYTDKQNKLLKKYAVH